MVAATPSHNQTPLSALERLQLIQLLNGLPSAQFEELVFALKLPPGVLPSNAAAAGNRTAELLRWAEGPTGPGLALLQTLLNGMISGQPLASSPSTAGQITGPYPTGAAVPVEAPSTLAEAPNSAHLVIAVFWQERSSGKFRVHPKLFYRPTATQLPLQESLIQDNCTVTLKAFPAFLKQLVPFTIGKLAQRVADSTAPWTLTIELFVPVDLLGCPLSIWCGTDGELIRSRAIVLGCSDRFDPDRPQAAADLHNQLKLGWQRLLNHAPDHTGAKLHDLVWLQSDEASQKNFEAYSGFQCYGDWLKPDEQAIAHWQELVRSGIPLALWMCEGTPPRPEIQQVFAQLTDTTRFEFLQRIQRIRDQQRKTCQHYVGVLYEDPTYVPDSPLLQDVGFFAWPGT